MFMLRRTKLYAGISLLVQSVTFLVMVIIFLFKNKKNTAGVFMAISLASGVAGSLLLLKEMQEEREEDELFDSIDDVYSDDSNFVISDYPEVPVDDTADETEFN